MFILYWFTGFLYNVGEMLLHAIPMSITYGNICANRDDFPWNIDIEEILDGLENGEELKGE
jgi:hypothetical protein